MLLPTVFNDSLFNDPFFNDFFDTRSPRQTRSFPVVNNMKSDIKEFDDAYQIEMQLPGYSREDVEVSIKDGYLTVSANHEENKDEQDENGKYIRKECYRGSCERSFYVGDHISTENVKASFKDGMLTLNFPKQEALPKEETKQLVEITE